MAESPQDEIMPLPQIKRMLSLAETKPLGCAFGLTKDKKECLLLIDKTAQGKKVATILKTDGKAVLDPGTMRFGKVNIDIENDPSTVRFSMNRAEAGGTVTTLLRLAKKAGYKGIVIVIDPEVDDDEQNDATAPVDADAVKARLTDLVKKLILRIAAEPARKDELTALAKQAQLLLSANDIKLATEKADELESVLNIPAGPPSDAAASSSIAAPGSEQASARLRDLVKRIPAVIASNPGSKAELLTLAGAANAKLKAEQPAEAAELIEALGKLIETASSAAKGDAGQPGATAEPVHAPDKPIMPVSDLDDLRGRISEVSGQASRLPEPAKSELGQRASKLLATISTADTGSLAAEIDALEHALARATTEARTAEAAATSGVTVSYRRLQFEWLDAQTRARKQLDQFVKQVLADKDIQQHAQFEEIKEGLDDAVGQLPSFGNELERNLAAIDDAADGTARQTARLAAVKVVDGYRAMLQEAGDLRALQAISDDEFQGISFYAELSKTLNSLGSQLAK